MNPHYHKHPSRSRASLYSPVVPLNPEGKVFVPNARSRVLWLELWFGLTDVGQLTGRGPVQKNPGIPNIHSPLAPTSEKIFGWVGRKSALGMGGSQKNQLRRYEPFGKVASPSSARIWNELLGMNRSE